jgi:hypothetical protein
LQIPKFLKKEVISKFPFDSRSFKTDSDTLQLGRIYEAGYAIPILKSVLSIALLNCMITPR